MEIIEWELHVNYCLLVRLESRPGGNGSKNENEQVSHSTVSLSREEEELVKGGYVIVYES